MCIACFSVLNVEVTEVLGRLGNIELGLIGSEDDWQVAKVKYLPQPIRNHNNGTSFL